MTHPSLVQDLLNPQAYPEGERPPEVALRETHISWLFLAGPFVYKVKKPVDFGFLDFTTREKRRFYCGEEVRLNQRLSPDVYLGVAEVRLHRGRHALYGPGRVVDYAVKMRRLPDDRWLSSLLERGQATPEMVRRIARRVARFHASAETDERITRIGGLETVRFNAGENFAQTRPYIGLTISREVYDLVRAYSETFLEVREPLFRQREAQGRIRDCHGDLHTAQICLEDGIAFIDCIEFNERFRFSDVAADLAFLAMDLDFHHRPDLSRALVEEYVRASGDAGLLGVLDYYKTYRAYVRGKVESFRLDQPGLQPPERAEVVERARRYFDLSAHYSRPGGPLLIITAGLMGTGKSTLALALAGRLGAEVISSDVVRKTLAGLAPTQHRYEPWGQGIYSQEFSHRTYREVHRRALERLREGRPVVIDASYRERAWREEALQTARQAGAPFLALEVVCPLETVRRRLSARPAEATPSDGRTELLEAQARAMEPITELPPGAHIVVDSSGPPEEVAFHALREVLRHLLQQSGGEHPPPARSDPPTEGGTGTTTRQRARKGAENEHKGPQG